MGNMSHDLKTPMQALATELSTLKELHMQMRAEALEELHNSITSSLESIQTLQDVNSFMLMTVNRNLDYTKASTGMGLSPANSTIDLHEALTWAVDCVTRTCFSPVVPELEPPSTEDSRPCTHVITDYQWLVENLLCLVSNAVKCTANGSIKVRYFVCDGGASLRFEVEDTGIGIRDEKKSVLFLPYQQAQERAGGTGLGLYSLSKRVEASGGHHGVSDRADGQSGSLFWFTIPYLPDEAAASYSILNRSNCRRASFDTHSVVSLTTSQHNIRESDSVVRVDKGKQVLLDSSTPGVASRRSSESPKILVIDDSMVIQKTTVRMLKRCGFAAAVASNGKLGLDLLLQEQYDLVLMGKRATFR